VVVKLFQEYESLSIQEITALTYIRTDDVISTLQTLNLIRYHEGQQCVANKCSGKPLIAKILTRARGCSIIDLSSAPPQLLNPKPFTVGLGARCQPTRVRKTMTLFRRSCAIRSVFAGHRTRWARVLGTCIPARRRYLSALPYVVLDCGKLPQSCPAVPLLQEFYA
jgi:hypothetical protein